MIALLTDFGLADTYVAQMKAVIWRHLPATPIIDLTHEIPAFDVWTGAWQLASGFRWLPPGSVTVAIVDPGVGTERRILVVEAGGRFLLAPDNGLLTLVLQEHGVKNVAVLRSDWPKRDEVAPTFHGRDLFAPAAARVLASGGIASVVQASAHAELPPMMLPTMPLREGKGWQATVLAVDRFGNIITNLGPQHCAGWRTIMCEPERGETVYFPVGRKFSDSAPGRWIAYLGSGGKFELARNQANAAANLQLKPGATVTLLPV